MPPLAPLVVLALVALFAIRRIQARRRAVPIDATLGDPTARALLDATRRGDGDAVATILSDTPDPVVRHHALMLLKEVPGRPGWADGLIDRQPHQQAAWLASAASLIGHAWEIRGSGYAASVEEDAWPAFFTVLVEADHQLERAIKLDRDDAMPWVLGLITARGLQLDRPVADERFRAAIARSPFHPGAIDQRLQHLCCKWHGSAEEMFALARWVLSSAPPGSPAHRAVPMAHIEHRLALVRDSSGAEARAHFSRPEVVAELRAAATPTSSTTSTASRPSTRSPWPCPGRSTSRRATGCSPPSATGSPSFRGSTPASRRSATPSTGTWPAGAADDPVRPGA
jgi:hypothetical protein